MKKILACVMAIATIGSISAIPTDAIIYKDSTVDPSRGYSEKYDFVIQEAVFVVDDGEYSATYYFKYDENKGFPIQVDDDFDTSNVDIVINVNNNPDDGNDNGFLIDTPYGYYTVLWYYYTDERDCDSDLIMPPLWLQYDSMIEKSTTIGDTQEIILGDSVETVGGSDTGIRGDINYDGKVNVSDLIYLRRYLLHLIKW